LFLYGAAAMAATPSGLGAQVCHRRDKDDLDFPATTHRLTTPTRRSTPVNHGSASLGPSTSDRFWLPALWLQLNGDTAIK
jgi:hypothetical protein